MWTFSHTEQTTATPETLWQIYSRPADWPEWDHGLVSVSVDGAMQVGTTGRLKPRGGPATTFVFTEVTPLKSFTDTTRLPLARLEFSHHLERVEHGTRMTHGVTITGPATRLFARLIGARTAKDLPGSMRSLIALAEMPPVGRRA